MAVGKMCNIYGLEGWQFYYNRIIALCEYYQILLKIEVNITKAVDSLFWHMWFMFIAYDRTKLDKHHLVVLFVYSVFVLCLFLYIKMYPVSSETFLNSFKSLNISTSNLRKCNGVLQQIQNGTLKIIHYLYIH